MPDFDRLQTALERLGAHVSAPEAHGTLCALLLDNAELSDWMQHTLDEMPDSGDVLAQEQIESLARLFESTREQLHETDLGLELLLPDDSDTLESRLIGLAGWCQGFLYGIGVRGLGERVQQDEEAMECLSDLLEVSKLSHDEIDSDENEQHYVEVVEHVRMATLLLHESLNPLETPDGIH